MGKRTKKASSQITNEISKALIGDDDSSWKENRIGEISNQLTKDTKSSAWKDV